MIRPFGKWLIGLACTLLAFAPATAAGRGPLVLGAASLQESLTAAAAAWTRAGHSAPVLSFAASSALARQIESGAPADLFISADEAWMDHIQQRGLVRPGTRARFLGNRLVLVAPARSPIHLDPGPGFALSKALGSGRLAMADPQFVPAGRYGRAALTRLGVWRSVAGRIVGAENVRAALALVERGEAPLGIVYETDARASAKVRIVGWFPPASYPAIAYPLAILSASRNREAEAFRAFLLSAPGEAIFRRHGFIAL